MAYKIICYGDSNTYGACGFAGCGDYANAIVNKLASFRILVYMTL